MQPLQIGAQVYKPRVNPCSLENLNPRPRCSTPGSDAEILGYLLEVSNISYKLQPHHNMPWGAFVNGTWNNMLGLVLNGTIDTVSTTYFHLKIRTDHFDFSYPFRMSPYVFLVGKTTSGVSGSAGIIFQMFHPILWAVLLTSVIAVSLGAILIAKIRHATTIGTLDSLWNCFRFFIDQYEPIEEHSLARNVLFVGGSFLTLVFLPLYQNGLLTQLLLPRIGKPFQSATDLVHEVQAGTLRFIDRQGTHAFYQEVAMARSSFTKSVHKGMTQLIRYEP